MMRDRFGDIPIMSIELIPSFLHFKWQQTRFCFYFLLFAHFIFSMTYSGYVVLLYNTICDPLEWRDRGPSIYYICKRLCILDLPYLALGLICNLGAV